MRVLTPKMQIQVIKIYLSKKLEIKPKDCMNYKITKIYAKKEFYKFILTILFLLKKNT